MESLELQNLQGQLDLVAKILGRVEQPDDPYWTPLHTEIKSLLKIFDQATPRSDWIKQVKQQIQNSADSHTADLIIEKLNTLLHTRVRPVIVEIEMQPMNVESSSTMETLARIHGMLSTAEIPWLNNDDSVMAIEDRIEWLLCNWKPK